MNALIQLTKFMSFIGELPEIAKRADTERAGVILDAIIEDNPDFWTELVFCSRMDSPQTVLAYLVERFPYLAFLKTVPNVEPTITFLMDFIRERESKHENNPVLTADQSWNNGRCRPRTRATTPRQTGHFDSQS